MPPGRCLSQLQRRRRQNGRNIYIILYNSDRCGVVWGGDGAGTLLLILLLYIFWLERVQGRGGGDGFRFCFVHFATAPVGSDEPDEEEGPETSAQTIGRDCRRVVRRSYTPRLGTIHYIIYLCM